MITYSQKINRLPQQPPTAKALEYAAFCREQLAKPQLKKNRRAELEEDLHKIETAHFVSLNNVTHFYLDEGPTDGVPIVFVHGWDCSSFWWHNVIKELNLVGYRTINYDLRGHGLTDDPTNGDYSVASMVADLEALAEKLNLKRFHLFAFSVGALVATAFAARHSDKVASIAFFNYGLFEYNPKIEKAGPHLLSFVFSKVLRKIKHWQPVYGYVRLTLVKNKVARRDIQYGMLSLQHTSPGAALGAARSVMSKEVLTNLPEWAKSLKMPVLLVAGSHDKVISLASSRKLAALIPHCTYFIMPNCGHLILGELPVQVAALLKMHIERTNLNGRYNPQEVELNRTLN